jgi:preprotein translocase subunit SecA
LWMEHLEAMDYLRSSVNLRAYGQREPIVEYKKDGLQMFKEMEEAFFDQVFTLVSNINPEQAKNAKREENGITQTLITNEGQGTNTVATKREDTHKDIGRNDPCPCGSGKKYKKCGLLNTPEHQKLMQGK